MAACYVKPVNLTNLSSHGHDYNNDNGFRGKKLQPFLGQAAVLIMAEPNVLGLSLAAHFSPILFLSFLPLLLPLIDPHSPSFWGLLIKQPEILLIFWDGFLTLY